jgi:hypothetical protein
MIKQAIKHPLCHVCLVVSLVFALYVPALYADTQVSISASDNLVFIGNRIGIKIIVRTTETIDKINVTPNQDATFETLTESATQIRKQQEYTVFEKDIQVAFFKTGDFNIGPYSIQLLKAEEVLIEKKTNSVPVTVKTSLTEEDKDIKDLKAPIEVKGDPFYILKYVIAALILIGLIIFLIVWWKKRKNAVPTPTQPMLSPLQELEVRTAELINKRYHEKGNPKLHFIEMTRILKHFLFRQYLFNAEDFTTYETMLVLRQKEGEITVLDNMLFLFNTADLVKFAKFLPDTQVYGELYDKIQQMITVYKKRLVATMQPKAEENT